MPNRKSRFQDLEQTLRRQAQNQSAGQGQKQGKRQPSVEAQSFDHNEPIDLRAPGQGQTRSANRNASVQAMAFDHNQPIDLRYDQATGSYTPNTPIYAAAQSAESDLDFSSEAFQVEPFDAEPIAPQSIPSIPAAAAERSPSIPTQSATPSVQSFGTDITSGSQPTTPQEVTTADNFLADLQAILGKQKSSERSPAAPLQPEVMVERSQPLPTKSAALPTPSVGPAFSADTTVVPEPATPKADITEDDFLADLQAILNGEKTYDGNSKQDVAASSQAAQLSVPESPIPVPSTPSTPAPVEPVQQTSPHDVFDRMAQGIAPESSPADPPAPTPSYSSAHSVFDRMGKNIAYANSFDLGTISLQQRFDEFDQILDAEEKRSRQVVSRALDVTPPSALMTTEQLQKEAGEKSVKARFFTSFSTYAVIINKLSKYEEIVNVSTASALEKLSLLMQINDEINIWLARNANDTSKLKRQKALRTLQNQIGKQIEELSKTPVVQQALPAELVKLLLEGSDYIESPTILFSYLMERVVAIYRVGEITQQNFRTELRNFLIANNDLIGSTSFALQTLGGHGDIRLGFDVGKFIFPCFGLEVEVSSGATITANRLIATECQALLDEDRSIKRYCLMNMNGLSTKVDLGVSVSVGVEVGTPSADSIIETLEIGALNCIPQETPSAKAEAGAGASVGGKITGTFLQVSDPVPTHFNLLEEIEDKLFEIVTSKNQAARATSKHETYFSLFSHAYNLDAEIGAEASAEAALTEHTSAAISAEVKAGVYAGVKFSKYTYQTKLSHGVYKTQATTMFLKQISTAAEAGSAVEVKLGESADREQDIKNEYDILNALQYESSVIYWNKKTTKITDQGRSGFSVGHSVVAENLINNFLHGKPEKKAKYVASLAKVLRVKENIMENFLNNCLKDRLVSDILGVQKDGHFFEANFILSNPIDFELDKDGQPSASTFKGLSKPQNHILQSLRFRTALQGSKNQEKTWFKLGLNLKVVSLGIDLGRVEDASSLKLTDYVVNWYTPNGDLSDSPPNNYVPASFLFI